MNTIQRHITLGVLSPGIWQIPHLRALLPEAGRIVRLGPAARFRLPPGIDAIAGWGMRPTAAGARRLAARHGVPYLALEEGFVRSLGPAALGFATLSLVVDRQGIYYDASQPSDLETMLESADLEPLLDEAEAAMGRLRETRLSKVNIAPDLAPGDLDGLLSDATAAPARRLAEGRDTPPIVLVVDQTFGDMSVALGGAGPETFHDMVEAALDENPGARVVVKLHPEVMAGRRRGYLAERAAALGVPALAREVNPISLLDQVARVYVATSQLGMEALISGVPVTCFGLPFYAGWGATDDRLACPRRTRRRRAVEIFAAAYLAYGRYVDPLTGTPCRLAQLLDRLTVMKRADRHNHGSTIGVGFAPWKRRYVAPFLGSTAGRVVYLDDPVRAVARARAEGGRICCWASREPAGLAALAEAAGVPLVRVEDGFLRSVGLGSDLLPAASLVFDRRGIYYDPTRPSDLEDILERGDFDAPTLAAAGRLRQQLIATGISKYNTGVATPAPRGPDRQPRILVPGQVEDDASVRLGGGTIGSNLDLLCAVRRTRPDALIVFKPHPDVESGNRPGAVNEADALTYADVILWHTNPIAALGAVDEVHTLTSLLGFEALLRGVPVTTHGGPFYAGWGLTTDHMTFPRRTRRLDLDQLVAGAMIHYPSYVDPISGLACDAQTVASRLAAARDAGRARPPARPSWWRQLRRGLRAARLAVVTGP